MEVNPSCQNFGKHTYQPELITKYVCETLVMNFDRVGEIFEKGTRQKHSFKHTGWMAAALIFMLLLSICFGDSCTLLWRLILFSHVMKWTSSSGL